MIDERVIKDIVTLEDGFQYYWVENKGAMSAYRLREIADYLDAQNEELNQSIEKYFAEHP